jgi:predicted ATPase
LWQTPPRRRANTWLERDGPHVTLRDRDEQWVRLGYDAPSNRSILAELGEPERFPEVFALRERVRRWRFYDGFRTDVDSSLRHPRVSVRTGALAHDGRDLAAALQTILEIGDAPALRAAVSEAFPGSELEILGGDDARLQVGLRAHGLLRTLSAIELSDGTLRYLCLLAALMSPRPPELLVLNEPEQSLHPDLLLPLARQIVAASQRSQVWVISHAPRLVADLEDAAGVAALELEREFGETRLCGQGMLDEPPWP